MASSSKTIRKLEVVSPVPADIDIANSIQPLLISEIAESLNLSPEHYDLYGKYKAKVEALLWAPLFFPISIFCFVFFIQVEILTND
jgi:Formate--tetrahydrofolate ligase